jgi:hypothetical protein
MESLTDLTRVVEIAEPFIKEPRDAAGDGFVELIKLLLSRWIELNRPLMV